LLGDYEFSVAVNEIVTLCLSFNDVSGK